MRDSSPAVLAVTLLLVTLSCDANAEDMAEYQSDVQPIFAKHCYECHGPSLQESDYRLDVRDIAINGGDLESRPIVPGKAGESDIIRYVTGQDKHRVMPPDGPRLSKREVTVLRNWMNGGAVWPDELAGKKALQRPVSDHWSLQPIVDSMPPAAKVPGGGDGAIDAFVQRRLAEKGLSLSRSADSITLLRRVVLDMHGLPPTDQQVAKYGIALNDVSYRKLVDEALASPHYGERWARHWLDVVRFGESTGYEVNRDRENAYHYRDYVIDALNADKSYRDFVIEQLAGDMVGVDAGTGFLVGGPHDIVKSPDVTLTQMQRQDELADYVNTTSTTFLAMTVGCARCHNHKFDPILQRDYYAMQAVFAGVQHGERPLRGPAHDAVQLRIEKLENERAVFDKAIDEFRELAKHVIVKPDSDEPTKQLDPVNFAHNVDEFPSVLARYIRFRVLATSNSEPCLDELEVFSEDDRNVALASLGSVATASGNLPNYEIHQIKHINDGKLGNSHSWISNTPGGGWIQIELPNPEKIRRVGWGRDRTGVVKDRLATKYVIEVATELGEWTTVATSDRRKPFSKTTPDDDFIRRLTADQANQARNLVEKRKRVSAKIKELQSQIPKAYVGTFKSPEVIHRLFRGDPQSPREVVQPDTLSVLGSLKLSNSSTESERRLALAQWIASEANPLTARVIVNRVWHYHFGTGMVATPSDFGINGGQPSHPELLDWLATNFMRNGWSLKWLHRQILLSRTYRQSSRPRNNALAKDADSRLLWRFPPRRLEAEAIRDCILHVAGSLNPKRGGPGFLLFDINHENVHHYYAKKELGPEEFRRMIYMMKIRQEQDEVFGVFDCPDGGQTIPDRSRSTTPLQALNLLNSRFVLDQAATLAKRVKDEAGDKIADQVQRVFELAFSRKPDEDEQVWAERHVKEQGLVELCRAIFNSNEFLFLATSHRRLVDDWNS